jgi:hypothetical protein
MRQRRGWYVAAALTGLGGLFLVVAAIVRWFPCFGNDDSATCLVRQGRGFDYLTPVEPWQASPATAVLAGIGLLLMASAWPLIVRELSLRRPVARAAVLVVMTSKPLLLGLLVLAAPMVGVLPRQASAVLLGVQIGLDLAALVVVLTLPNRRLSDHQRYQRLLVGAVAFWVVGWVGQVLDALIFGLLAPEAEVPPGSGLLTGVVVLICGGGIATLTATAQERQSPAGAARNALERPTHG